MCTSGITRTSPPSPLLYDGFQVPSMCSAKWIFRLDKDKDLKHLKEKGCHQCHLFGFARNAAFPGTTSLPFIWEFIKQTIYIYIGENMLFL